jgi:hypothetical protein
MKTKTPKKWSGLFLDKPEKLSVFSDILPTGAENHLINFPGLFLENVRNKSFVCG